MFVSASHKCRGSDCVVLFEGIEVARGVVLFFLLSQLPKIFHDVCRLYDLVHGIRVIRVICD